MPEPLLKEDAIPLAGYSGWDESALGPVWSGLPTPRTGLGGKYYPPRPRKGTMPTSGGRRTVVFSSEFFRLGLEIGVDAQQPQQGQD